MNVETERDGRNELSWEQKFERDVWYVDHMNFGLDMKILVKTIVNVLKHQGINAGVNDTMVAFDEEKNMQKLIIVGAGGFGRELLQWCKDINNVEPTWVIKGFIDDNPNALLGYECDYSVIGSINDWLPSDDEVFALAIAVPEIKRKVVEKLLSKGAVFTSVIHPSAHIGNFSSVGKGVVLYPDSRVTVNAHVGDYVVLLDHTFIGHDASIGDYTTIFGSCGINGHDTVGREVLICSHVTIVPEMRIGNRAFVGAGSVVVKDIKEEERVFGVPARRIMPQ